MEQADQPREEDLAASWGDALRRALSDRRNTFSDQDAWEVWSGAVDAPLSLEALRALGQADFARLRDAAASELGWHDATPVQMQEAVEITLWMWDSLPPAGDPVSLSFPYRPGWRVQALGAVFFAIAGWFLWMKSGEPSGGLVINHLIELGPQGAQRFYLALAGLSVVFVMLGLYGVYAGITSRHVLSVDVTGISAPRNGFAREPTRLEFTEIAEAGIQEFKGQVMLSIIPRQGRKLVIMQGWLPDKEAFQAVSDAVYAGLRRLHG